MLQNYRSTRTHRSGLWPIKTAAELPWIVYDLPLIKAATSLRGNLFQKDLKIEVASPVEVPKKWEEEMASNWSKLVRSAQRFCLGPALYQTKNKG